MYRFALLSLCIASSPYLCSSDAAAMSSMCQRHNITEVTIDMLSNSGSTRPRRSIERTYTHIPQGALERINNAPLIEKRKAHDRYFKRDAANGDAEYACVHKSRVCPDSPTYGITTCPTICTITPAYARGNPHLASKSQGTRRLRSLGFYRVFDLYYERSYHAIYKEEEQAGFGITIDTIRIQPKGAQQRHVPSNTLTPTNRVRIGYAGNAHSYWEVSRCIDTLARRFAIADREDQRKFMCHVLDITSNARELQQQRMQSSAPVRRAQVEEVPRAESTHREAENTATPSSTCSICFENLDNASSPLGCGHRFHTECVEQWREQSNSCPMCRRAIGYNTNRACCICCDLWSPRASEGANYHRIHYAAKIILNCNHIFHRQCLTAPPEIESYCPVCGNQIRSVHMHNDREDT